MTSPSGRTELDPFTDEFQQCPFPALAALRATSPVQALVEPGWYIVTTMDLVREVLTDPGRFSNQVSRRTSPPPEVAEKVAEIRAQGFPLPVWAISRVLGLPDERRDDVRRWTDAATATIGAQLAADRWPEVEQDLLDFQRAIAAELERRRDDPSDDLLSALVQATTVELDPAEQAIGVGELVNLTRELMVERIDVARDRPLRYLPSLIVRGLVELPVRVRRRVPEA